jgi:hypothetical protein
MTSPVNEVTLVEAPVTVTLVVAASRWRRHHQGDLIKACHR